MKKDCEVVRDLMPLVLDDVASDGSKHMVSAHVQTCAQCAAYMNQLKADLPAGKKSELDSRAAFDAAAQTLRAGLRAYERKIAGYTAPEAILTGLETRTSSPVRLKREENFECAQLAGLYPCGEGAGYAGGIMSAAVDGLRVARAIISRYSPAEG